MKKILIILFCMNLFISNIAFADDDIEVEELQDTQIELVSSNSSKEPITYSKNIIVIDRKTLLPLYEKDAYTKVAMASTTKILTCILAIENSSMNEIVTISQKAATVSGSTLGLITGMEITMNDLLYGLMLRSGNDCAIAVAEHISGSVENFSILMNQKSSELGLQNSNFITPHGLDNSNHYTTAYDLAILTDYALKNSTFREIVSCKNYTISFNGFPRTISNTNELLGNLEGVYGVKTGFTFEAGRCLVSACKRNDLDIIVVVLGANTKNIRTKDSYNLINYIFDTYSYINISSTLDDAFSNYISYFNENYFLEKTTTSPILKLDALENYNFPLSSTDVLELHTKFYTIDTFNSDILPGSTIGKLYLYKDQTLLCEVNVIIENQLIRNDWKYYLKNIFSIYKLNNNL